MNEWIEQIESSNELNRVWRIPFENDDPVAVAFIKDYICQILGGDVSIAGTSRHIFFNLHSDTSPDNDTIRLALLNDPQPLWQQSETVYILMGATVFRYVTIEYTSTGLGILSDYQLSS